MPYIIQEKRDLIDGSIDHFIAKFHSADPKYFGVSDNGLANYIITRIILGILKPETGWTYSSLSDVIKTLECSKLEIYRRLVSPYEDKCIYKNGDLMKEFGDEI